MLSSRLAPALARRVAARSVCAGGAPRAAPSAPQPASAAPPATDPAVTARVMPVTPAPPSYSSVGGVPRDIGDIPDPHTHDPLKWRKAAWKYLGAVGIFAVFYKALHWYVDGVVAEGRRKREDMERAKTEVYETPASRAAEREADRAKAAALLAAAQRPLGALAPGEGEAGGPPAADGVGSEKEADSGAAPEKFQLFKSVREEVGYVSPEDELKLLEIELESRLKSLGALRSPSREEEEAARAAEEELFDVRKELADFASKGDAA